MKPNRRVLFAVILAVMGGTTACERTDGLGQLTGPVTQQFAKVGGGPRILQRNRSASTDEVCSRPISKNGGTFSFDGGSVVVSRNAVSSATIFCAANHAGSDIQIDLTAYDPNGTLIHTFRAPVKLTLDLSDVTITDWSRIYVVYRNPNGTLEPVPTAQDKNNRSVTALLQHFSDYSPVTD